MGDFAVTALYKRVIPTMAVFSNLCSQYAPSIDLSDGAWVPIAQQLYYYYCNSNIRYDSADAFCRHFFFTFSDEYPRYKARLAIIAKEYELTPDDLTVAGQLIQNEAQRPNEKVENPLDTVVPYISHQMSSKSRLSKIDAYLRALDDYTNNYARDFIDKFRQHFMQVLPTGEYLF